MAIFDFLKKFISTQPNSSNNTQKSTDREIDVSAIYGEDGEIFNEIPKSQSNLPNNTRNKQTLER
jgi:hypothetical protein